MTAGRPLTRRDFLSLRRTESGKQLDVSCRALYMRCADAAIAPEPPVEWEPWMGEPPAVISRRSAEEIFESLEQELADVQVLCLLDAEWLDNLADVARVRQMIERFVQRGGRVETKRGN